MFNFNSINVNNTKQAAWLLALPIAAGGAVCAAKYAYCYFAGEKAPSVTMQSLAQHTVRCGVAGAVVGGIGALATGDKNVAQAVIKAAGAAAGASVALSGKRFV